MSGKGVTGCVDIKVEGKAKDEKIGIWRGRGKERRGRGEEEKR